MNKAFGWIPEARKAKGMTQERLASKIGISQSELSKYEKGRKPVPEKEMKKISRIELTEVLKIKDSYFATETI